MSRLEQIMVACLENAAVGVERDADGAFAARVSAFAHELDQSLRILGVCRSRLLVCGPPQSAAQQALLERRLARLTSSATVFPITCAFQHDDSFRLADKR